MSQSPDARLLLGQVIADKYLVEELVGEGGFGVVFRARHQIWDQPVALKCFTALSNAPMALREALLEQFVQEGKIMGALSSRSAAIVQARDIGTLTTPDGCWLPYMVLEWLQGRSLDAMLRDAQHRGRERDALTVFRLLDGPARALAMAHHHGVAHRDIKPANFFVCGQSLEPGVVLKLLDFGIAKVMQAHSQEAASTTSLGLSPFTPNYGAPEQFDRQHGATGPWTDVFGMALVMLEVMSGGKRALPGESFMQLAYASQNEVHRPTPRALGLTVDDAVEAVFRKATAVKVLQRYPDLGAFWLALVDALGLRDYPPLEHGELSLAPSSREGVTTLRGAARLGESGPHSTTRPSRVVSAASRLDQGGRTISYGYDETQSVEDEPGRGAGATELVDRRGRAETLENVAEVTRALRATPKSSRRSLLTAAAFVLVIGGVSAGVVLGARMGGGDDRELLDSLQARGDEGATPAADAPKPKPEPEPLPEPPRCPEGMAFVEGGKFFMGTDDESKPVLRMAAPAHKVEVQSFCMDVHEVTSGEYGACSDEGECKRAFRDSFWPQGDSKRRDWERQRDAYSELCTAFRDELARHPINCVTWAQADEYCRVHGKRLPAEAEWEYAARGSDGRVFPWGDAPPAAVHLNGCGTECQAWRDAHKLGDQPVIFDADDGFFGTAPVGSFPAGKTQAGLLDMVGNVFEWTADEFYPYPAKDEEPDPEARKIPTNNRVIRGGAFNSFMPDFTDPALRFPLDADAHSHGVGFRCARDPSS
ncbi:MAG: SUMF1/EgtB/PvdO family nonheme iron enzyme [Myxococcales bacterium]|nr:SUMF1/EgtB/PvdO family nonheme iron enzyme [Myxococcales bacterium]